MAKEKRKRMSPKERAAWEAHLDERVRQLREAARRAEARFAAEHAKSGDPGASPRPT
jgi:hypothetical protein